VLQGSLTPQRAHFDKLINILWRKSMSLVLLRVSISLNMCSINICDPFSPKNILTPGKAHKEK